MVIKNAEAENADVEVVEHLPATTDDPGRFQPGVDSWDSLKGESDSVLGFDLAKGELADALEGIPHMITRVVFRPGIRPDSSMVSCEGIVAPEEVLRKRRVNIADLPFEPEGTIVYNDGSTGIYRQIMRYLEAKSIIRIEGAIRDQGKLGESSYDLGFNRVLHSDAVHGGIKANGEYEYYVNIRLYCPRGLRLSDYDYNGQPAKTRYLG
jgi:hypothetical protein